MYIKRADDFMSPTVSSPETSPSSGVSQQPPPPTMTSIPREDFDKILASKGVTYDQHLDNLESHFDGATPEQQKRGRVWYRAAGDTLRDIGKKFGIGTNRAIAMGAALSGRTDWNNNLHFVAHMSGNYRPGENEDEWRRAAIHPSAMARYMENKYDILPGPKAEGDLSHPGHFSIKELKQLHKGGYMPRTKDDFVQLANAHSGNHLQYIPPNNRTGAPEQWVNKPLRGFEGLQTPEGQQEWLDNARMSMRGGTESAPNKWNPIKRKKGEPPVDPGVRKPWEDVIDAHMRSVKDTTSDYGYHPTSAFTGAGVPTLGGNIDKAKLLRQVPEEEFNKYLNGPKYKAFFSNLGNKLRFRKSESPDDQGYYDHGGKHWTEHDPEYLRSTIDTQHMRASATPHGMIDAAPGYKDSAVVTPQQYEVYQQGLIDLTHRINSKRHPSQHLMPHQVQAIIWGKFKDDLDSRPDAKSRGVGQTYWSPTMDDIQGFGDRYSRRLLALMFGEEQWHINPALLEHPQSSPWHTDSDEWMGNVLNSWHQNHQHELSSTAGDMRTQDPHLAQVSRAHLAAFDDFDEIMGGQSFPHQMDGGSGGDHPWKGEYADALRAGCKYCGADPDEMCDPHCPTNHSEDPKVWERDYKALGGPPAKAVDDTMFRLNNVRDVLGYVNKLLSE